jgi:hypothetical protein
MLAVGHGEGRDVLFAEEVALVDVGREVDAADVDPVDGVVVERGTEFALVVDVGVGVLVALGDAGIEAHA